MIKAVHHIALRTTDIERLADFYRQALGFTPGLRLDFPDGAYLQVMELDGVGVELFGGGEKMPEDAKATGFFHLALTVDDVDAEYARLKALGCEFYIEPRDVQGLRVAFFRDPDGNAVELIRS